MRVVSLEGGENAESELIFLHDNVHVATGVGFVTHDAIHDMLNNTYESDSFVEKVGCIEIMDNVFIGSGTRILYNTRIGIQKD